MTNAIRTATTFYGRLWEKRIYFDSRKASEIKTDRLNLDQSGFTLVDCPTRGKKDTLDKKMIVDILGFAWERVSRGIRTCVVLISSDSDYSYTLSKLRDIGVFTVVIHGRLNVTADVLLDCCDVAMSLHHVLHDDDILTRPPNSPSSSPDDVKLCSHDERSKRSGWPFGRPGLNTANPDGTIPTIPALARESSTASSIAAAEGAFQLLCHCVDTVQRRGVCWGGSIPSVHTNEADDDNSSWVLDTAVALVFYSKSGEHVVPSDQKHNRRRRNEDGDMTISSNKAGYYKIERQRAIAAGFLETGRMDLTTRNIVVCHTSGGVAFPHGQLVKLSQELYVRLTRAGKELQKGVWVEDEDAMKTTETTAPSRQGEHRRKRAELDVGDDKSDAIWNSPVKSGRVHVEDSPIYSPPGVRKLEEHEEESQILLEEVDEEQDEDYMLRDDKYHSRIFG